LSGRPSRRRTRKQLKRSAAPSGEIARKRRANARPKPVTRRWVEPKPRVERPAAPPTEKQLAYITSLARRAGVAVPEVSTRQDASEAIGRLRQFMIWRGERDPGRKGQERHRLQGEHRATVKRRPRRNANAWRTNREWMSEADWETVCAAMAKRARPP
jgi:hypothetical protein